MEEEAENERIPNSRPVCMAGSLGALEMRDDTGVIGFSMGKSDAPMGLAGAEEGVVTRVGGGGNEEEEEKGSTLVGGSGGQGPTMTLEAALLEVEARFLLNLPDEELSSVDRLFFQMEQAHWYYEDFLADQHETLPHFQLEGFTLALFQHSQLLRHLQERHEDMIRDFYSYKYAVPVYGCILLNSSMDKIVLVCNWERTAWGLPRGKVNEGEHPMDCAIRETLEECGFDASGLVKEQDSFTIVQNAKRITLYVVKDVPEDFPFQPQVRKEVSEVRFFGLDEIPRTSYNVQPCLAHLRRWMAKSGSSANSMEVKIPSSSPFKKGGGGRGRGPSPNKKLVPNGTNGTITPGPRQGRGGQQPQHGDKNKGGRTGSAGRSRSAPVQHHDAVNDVNNLSTFGAESVSWDVDSMFRANEKLTGRQFTYDGNPQRFGEYDRNGTLLTSTNASGRSSSAAAVAAGGPEGKSSGSTEVKASSRRKKKKGETGGLPLATATGRAEEEDGKREGEGQKQEEEREGDGAEASIGGLDQLDGFKFDTQDILAALLF